MKHYLKVFFISLLFFSIVSTGIIVVYIKNYSFTEEYNNNWLEKANENISSELTEDIITGDRINVLVAGLEGVRTDTIFVVSYNKKLRNAHIVSIPRDTHYNRSDFRFSENNKINSIYQVKGIEGLKSIVEEIMKIPIYCYIIVDYEGLRVAVDAVGGVEVDVPFHMKYDDPLAKPSLHIDIKQGKQILDGKTAMEFLRFRKGNPGYESYNLGDLDRIKVHQSFIKAALKKALSLDLIKAVRKVFPYINTDITLAQASSIALNVIGIDIENVSFYTLPGEDRYENKLSFYFYKEEELSRLVKNMYNQNSN